MIGNLPIHLSNIFLKEFTKQSLWVVRSKPVLIDE